MKNLLKTKLKTIIDLIIDICRYNIISRFRPLAPTLLQVNITYRCNSKCQMCQIWKNKPQKELDIEAWKKILKDPISLNIKKISIAGGEPTLYPNFNKLVKIIIESLPNLVSFGFVTNGFIKENVISAIRSSLVLTKKRGIKFWVTVSLDGIGGIHDSIRGVPNAFDRTSSTILSIKSLQEKEDFGLEISTVIFKDNLYHLKELEDWCRERNLFLNYQIIGFHKNYVHNLGKRASLDFRKKDKQCLLEILKNLSVNPFDGRIRDWLKSYYWMDMYRMYKDNKFRTTPCPFSFDAFVLDGVGDVYYCLSEEKIGNCLKGKSVSEIYYDPKNLKLRQKRAKTVCLKCNSACSVNFAIAKDFKKFARFCLTGRI